MRQLVVALLILCCALPAGAAELPLHESLFHADPRTPVVLVPGITGSKLRDLASGEVIWGRTGNLFGPHDGGRALALSIVTPRAPGAVTEPFDVIERLSLLGVFRFRVYEPVIDILEQHGYVRGNLRAPRPEDTLLVFPYDWRLGNVEGARELALALERLREVRGESTLRVVLLCHSNAARIVRWYVKYGGGTLEDAEAGRAAPPAGVRVDKVIFVGTGQGGALATLSEMDRGRSYAPLVGRKLRPEYLFTMPGLYEDLPAHLDDVFLDERGEPMDVDLYAPENWERYGWSIYGAPARKRLARLAPDDAVLGDDAARRRWLATTLETARRVHAQLHRDAPGFGSTRYYQVQNSFERTPARAVLIQNARGLWRTRTSDDGEVRRSGHLTALTAAPGDGHATRASQEWLSPQEQAAVAAADFAIAARHRELFTHPAALRLILEYLAD